jgi:aminopeptidase N
MEYSGLISMSGHAYRAYDGSPVSLLVDLTVHEIAHQWWYSAVGNDQVHDPWLDEAFAKYSELLFYERYYPEYADWWWQNHIYTRDLSGPLDSTIYEFPSTPAYIDRVYAQGARFLGDLRALMGDEAFFAFTRAYREANEGRLVTREDFFEAVRDHTSEDLTPLIESYFATP